jgi:hypothetical protein
VGGGGGGKTSFMFFSYQYYVCLFKYSTLDERVRDPLWVETVPGSKGTQKNGRGARWTRLESTREAHKHNGV